MSEQKARRALYFALCALRGYPVGSHYHRMLKENRDGIRPDTAVRKLVDLLAHCEQHVPYYAQAMRAAGSYRQDPEAYLTRLPILTKDIIRKRFDDLKSDDLPRRKWFFNMSSGSTGEPLNFIQDSECASRTGAVTLLFSRLVGHEVGQSEVHLWASPRDVAADTHTVWSRLLLRLMNVTILSACNMTRSEMRRYVGVLNAQRPNMVVAYASAMYELAKFADDEGLDVAPLPAVMVSADMLYPFMREKIEAVFRTTVYNRYGTREVGDIACERPGGDGLWVAPWGNYVEVVDAEGRRVPDGEEGEIVITCLSNYAMPFVRYKIGDRGVLEPGRRNGRQVLRVVVGRSNDMILGPDGKLIHAAYFCAMMSPKDWARKFQVIQKDRSKVTFRLVCRESDCPPSELDEITAKTRAALGDNCEVTFEFVDDIPTNHAGKIRHLISKVHT